MNLKVYTILGRWEKNPNDSNKIERDNYVNYSGKYNDRKNNRVVFFDKKEAQETLNKIENLFFGEDKNNKESVEYRELRKYRYYRPESFKIEEVDLTEHDWVAPFANSELWDSWIKDLDTYSLKQPMVEVHNRIVREFHSNYNTVNLLSETDKIENAELDTKNHYVDNKEMWDHHADAIKLTNLDNINNAVKKRDEIHMRNLIKQLKKTMKLGSDNKKDMWHYEFASKVTADIKTKEKYLKKERECSISAHKEMAEKMKKADELNKPISDLIKDTHKHNAISWASDDPLVKEESIMKRNILESHTLIASAEKIIKESTKREKENDDNGFDITG